MPAITITSQAVPYATISLQGTIAREVGIQRLAGGLISIEIAGLECGVRIVGRRDALRTAFDEAMTLLGP